MDFGGLRWQIELVQLYLVGVFEKLASDPTEQHKQWAIEFWKQAHRYDFSWDQMRCDKALLVLELARKGIDPDFPNEPEGIIYKED